MSKQEGDSIHAKREEIRNWLNRYLTEQFICSSDELPDDECLKEAKEILKYFVEWLLDEYDASGGGNETFSNAITKLAKEAGINE